MTTRKRPALPGRPLRNYTDAPKPRSSDHPQEWHADLGLVDDDHTPDMRQGTAAEGIT
jgi:hypothetical protein